jgi:drug/metabolite transporter (DMT)-like permease
MKVISPKLHGIIDYLVVLFLFASPTMFTMTEDIATYTYILGTVHLLLTILTNYSYGIFRLIPLQLHGLIELVVGAALVILAFTVLKYDERASQFYEWFGIAVLVVFAFSDYNRKNDTVKAPIL